MDFGTIRAGADDEIAGAGFRTEALAKVFQDCSRYAP